MANNAASPQTDDLHHIIDAYGAEEVRRNARIDFARRSVLGLARHCHHNYRPAHHHRIVAEALTRFAKLETRRLILTLPPRHGKSELASRQLPAFIFGGNPDAQIIACSYSLELARSMSRDVQSIMVDAPYRAAFPNVRLQKSSNKKRADAMQTYAEFEIVGGRGIYKCSGIGGGITGRGANFILVDDPFKSRKEADSLTYRNRAWEWFQADLLSRAEPPYGVLIIATRWHTDDITGRLLKQEPDAWEHIHFPLIQDDVDCPERPYDPRPVGRPLWVMRWIEPGEHLPTQSSPDPKTLPPGMSVREVTKDELEQRARDDAADRKQRSPKEYAALDQGRPRDAVGKCFKRAWMVQRYKVAPSPENADAAIQSWDFSAGSQESDASFACGHAWLKMGPDFWLMPHEIRDRMSFLEMKQAVRDLSAIYPGIHKKVVEKAASGPDVVDELEHEIGGFVLFSPGSRGSKRVRADIAAGFFETKNVWLPDPSIAPWIVDYVDELCEFPSEPNDRVDTTSQALIYLTQNETHTAWWM